MDLLLQDNDSSWGHNVRALATKVEALAAVSEGSSMSKATCNTVAASLRNIKRVKRMFVVLAAQLSAVSWAAHHERLEYLSVCFLDTSGALLHLHMNTDPSSASLLAEWTC